MNIKDVPVYFKVASETRSLINGIKIALVVGIVLNVINQGDRFLNMNLDQINWIKFALTFLVPFLVATYASLVTKFQFRVGAVSFVDTKLECICCKKGSTMVSKNELIPPCPNCQEKTKWKHKTISG